MTNRNFGIEFEIKGMNTRKAADVLNSINISCFAEGYNHNVSNNWKAVTDATVHNGCEVVSPILNGAAGIEQAMAVAEALSDAGASVDRQCGMHVHLDASDLTGNHLINLVKAYYDNEAEIDSLMPVSRRGSNNTMCASVRNNYNLIKGRRNEPAIYVASSTNRYVKLNLASYMRHGTIEFRQHSGTLNARKISMWIRFLSSFVEAQKNNDNAAPEVQIPGLSSTGRRIFNALQSQPYTADQLASSLNLSRSTIITQISRLRATEIQIRKFRGAYILSNQNQGVQAELENTDLNLWSGIEEDIVVFYNRRKVALQALVA